MHYEKLVYGGDWWFSSHDEISLCEASTRMESLPPGTSAWVHCQSRNSTWSIRKLYRRYCRLGYKSPSIIQSSSTTSSSLESGSQGRVSIATKGMKDGSPAMRRAGLPPLITLSMRTLSCNAKCILKIEINYLWSYTLADREHLETPTRTARNQYGS